ncbi:SHOCT domain-containing protein [bacterium]|nr:SHOCT domain-containing protein [bacterium]
MVGGALASFVKLIPILGQFVFVPVVYGATWAIGCAVDAYFDGLRTGQIPTADEIKDLFSRELSRGKAEGAAIGREEINRAHEELKRRVHERESGHKPSRSTDSPTVTRVTPSQGTSGDSSPKIRIQERHVRRPNEKPAEEPEEEKPAAPGKKLDLGVAPRKSEPAHEPEVAPAAKTIGPLTPPSGVAPASALPVEAAKPIVVIEKKEDKPDLVETLERLAKLHQAGALTAEEFEAAKKKLLAG